MHGLLVRRRPWPANPAGTAQILPCACASLQAPSGTPRSPPASVAWRRCPTHWTRCASVSTLATTSSTRRGEGASWSASWDGQALRAQILGCILACVACLPFTDINCAPGPRQSVRSPPLRLVHSYRLTCLHLPLPPSYSSHAPASPEEELALLIYSTPPVFSARFEVGFLHALPGAALLAAHACVCHTVHPSSQLAAY